MTRTASARTWLLAAALVTVLIAALLLAPDRAVAGPAVVAAADLTSAARGSCSVPSAGFKPTGAYIEPIRRTLRAVTVRRTRSGAVGTPPATRAGKWLLGWDPETRPGSGVGSVITVAHTWPDGSALGNALLRQTRKGAQVVVTGASGQRACYRVTKRASYRADRAPRRRS